MMSRWGPSEDCKICGQTCSWGHFYKCFRCEKVMCEWCLDHHDCHEICSDEFDEANKQGQD